MALLLIFSNLTLLSLLSMAVLSNQQPLLNSAEQESVYGVLDSINWAVPWRDIFPDNFCISAPHGVVCEASFDESNGTVTETAHIVELSFGYVSDFNPNPPCSPTQLSTLFSLPLSNTFGSSSSTNASTNLKFQYPTIIRNFTSLRRLVLTGNGFYGEIPGEIGNLVDLEEITLSRNELAGELPKTLAMLKKLKILDLSQNQFEGCLPELMGNLTLLLKLDLSSNRFGCKIPETFRQLQSLEFLDLSFNYFGNFGVPMFLGEIPRLKEVYLSGNLLGGKIPEIWENLGGVVRIGFSNMGLIGLIPASMGTYLRNLSYLGLDNNKLEGSVPEEFGLLQFAEINLENNSLSGSVPFSTKVGEKLKLAGNTGLCVDDKLRWYTKNRGTLEQLQLCNKPDNPSAVIFNGASLLFFNLHVLFFSLGILFVFTGL
ncbi:hypothetical protein L6164_034387 [Bauhinia variegata]|uniref:Uncharacterized protein n=1 Tax=Bauhinia variegata TaxID=167791 RepID=A0ACB9KUS0_BAUVA|nr:hypothetical protein L6164_034387 [Bauhinia variegata]